MMPLRRTHPNRLTATRKVQETRSAKKTEGEIEIKDFTQTIAGRDTNRLKPSWQNSLNNKQSQGKNMEGGNRGRGLSAGNYWKRGEGGDPDTSKRGRTREKKES